MRTREAVSRDLEPLCEPRVIEVLRRCIEPVRAREIFRVLPAVDLLGERALERAQHVDPLGVELTELLVAQALLDLRVGFTRIVGWKLGSEHRQSLAFVRGQRAADRRVAR